MAIQFRWRFSLRTLLLITAIVGAGIGLYFHYKQQTIVGLARFYPPRPGTGPQISPPQRNYGELKAELLHRLKSKEMLAEVLSDPKLANLPVLKGKTDPVAWFASRLELSFPGDSEILRVAMHMRKYREDADQGVVLVNAILDQCRKLSTPRPSWIAPPSGWEWEGFGHIQVIEDATVTNR